MKTTLENYKKIIEVKVLKNTTNTNNEEMNKMVGGIFEARAILDNDITVWNKDKSNWWTFKKEDCQIMTPLSDCNGERIGLGDWIKDIRVKWLVYDYIVEGGKLIIKLSKDNSLEITIGYSQKDINTHKNEIIKSTTLFSIPTNELIDEIERRGNIKEGKIII